MLEITCKALSVLKELSSNDQNEAEENENISLDGETLFQDLKERTEIKEVLNRNSVHRLACFTHTLQLVIKNDLNNCKMIRPAIAKYSGLSSKCHQSAQFKGNFEDKF